MSRLVVVARRLAAGAEGPLWLEYALMVALLAVVNGGAIALFSTRAGDLFAQMLGSV
ncbi:MAG: hypothetical protein NT069_36125 [Planctomycetota bacterium]|nr:hypothetical protein [Planctomycetota bacterium]